MSIIKYIRISIKKFVPIKDLPQYGKLLKQYRGQGIYLPKVNGNIDRKAILKNLHHYQSKLNFIDETISKFNKRFGKNKKFTNFAITKDQIDQTVTTLLHLKKQSHQAIRTSRKEVLRIESRKQITVLQNQFETFVDQIFFMKSFNFPNDFLAHREQYEKYKDLPGKKNKMKANQIFFFRKIVEDGAYDPDHTRPDKYIRTALDTLFLNIKKEGDFLSENVRYDLEWFERYTNRLVKRGKKVQLSRLKEMAQTNF